MAPSGEQGWGREGLRSKRSDRREAVAVIQVEGTEGGSRWREGDGFKGWLGVG